MALRREYPFDLAVCSVFRTTPAAPLNIVPCLLDVDAMPEPQGRLSRLLRPLELRAMRRRARPVRRLLRDPCRRRACAGAGRRDVAAARRAARPTIVQAERQRRVFLVSPMGWRPNRQGGGDAARGRSCLRLAEHGYTLRFAGAGTDEIEPRPGLEPVGFVDDIAREYAEAALVLCPILSGGGATIKLAEAVQHGCAVLASAHSAAGYGSTLVPGRDIETFRGPEDLVERLLGLLDAPDRLAALRSAARQAAATVLDIDAIQQIVMDEARRALETAHANRR